MNISNSPYPPLIKTVLVTLLVCMLLSVDVEAQEEPKPNQPKIVLDVRVECWVPTEIDVIMEVLMCRMQLDNGDIISFLIPDPYAGRPPPIKKVGASSTTQAFFTDVYFSF